MASAFAVFAYTNLAIYRVDTFDAVAKIDYGISTGINTDTDKINFGRIKPSTASSRFLTIDSKDYRDDLRVSIDVEGDIKLFVSAPEDFILKGGETAKIELEAIPKEGLKEGDYTGQVVVVYRRF